MSKPPGDAAVSADATRGVSRFYWGWLIFATSVSVLGNITHALLVAPGALRLLAAVASVVPPAFVLGSTHSVAVSLRMRRFALTYILGLSMTIGVAACAFFLSFDALRALAVILGWPAARAWLFPVAIDVSIAQATFGLLSAAPPPTKSAQVQALACGPTPSASEPEPFGAAIADARGGQVDTTETVRWTRTAHQLVRNGSTTKDAETVAAILAEHAAGTSRTTISRRRGVHHSTVGRILAAAADISP